MVCTKLCLLCLHSQHNWCTLNSLGLSLEVSQVNSTLILFPTFLSNSTFHNYIINEPRKNKNNQSCCPEKRKQSTSWRIRKKIFLKNHNTFNLHCNCYVKKEKREPDSFFFNGNEWCYVSSVEKIKDESLFKT